jgi:pyruvate formate lyase activating enzyme
VETVRKARDIGLEAGLHYVYTGNVFGDRGESTFCHQCGEILLERTGFSVQQRGMKQGVCLKCGARVAGVGLP